jgi:transposase-like protein
MDLPRLHTMWSAGARVEDIALAFSVSPTVVYRWRRDYKLPDRPLRRRAAEPYAPTPAEIERHKAEFYRQHLERLRDEHPDVTRARVRREVGGEPC